jgi:hypothetical protein
VLVLASTMQPTVIPRPAAWWHVIILRGRPTRPQRRSERVVVCVGPHPRAQQQAALHARRRRELGSGGDFRSCQPQFIPLLGGDRSVARTVVSVRFAIASVDRPVRRQANARAVRQRHCMHQERLHSFSHRWHRLPVCGELLLQVPARRPESRLDPQPLAFRSLHLRVARIHHPMSRLLSHPAAPPPKPSPPPPASRSAHESARNAAPPASALPLFCV